MALDADPYRTLGLSRGATDDEIRRAYRRLAKANHPDAAGEKALPRFLAIQAAYEQLAGDSRPSARGWRAGSTPRWPWESDASRGDATRRAYGSQGRGAGGTRGAGSTRRAPPGSAGTPPGAGGATDGRTGGRASAGSGPRPGAPGGAGRSRRRSSEPRQDPGRTSGDGPGATKSRSPNKATLGSTSYDGADAGPFEPDWAGASWYGTTSGTYWTLNPKEYADPRKHGPEYQARARRTARGSAGMGGRAAPGAMGATGDAEPDGPDPDPAPEDGAGPAAHGRSAGPTHTTTSWWDSTAGPAGGTGPDVDPFEGAGSTAAPGRRRRSATGAEATPAAEPAPPDLGRAAADFAHALTDARFGGPRGRFVRAAIGWLPIALGLGWMVGEMTGCGRFAATCDGSAVEPLLLVVQVAVFIALLLVPAVAAVAATAALTLFVAAVAASLILSATGGAADGDSRRAALGFVLMTAWLIGFGLAVARWARTVRSPTSPVS